MNISASQLSSDSNAKAVETQVRIAVFNAYSFEKIEPSFSGTLWADIGLRYSLVKHGGEQRNEFFMEPCYVCFAALGPKHYLTSLDINVPYRVEIRFGKPATLIPSNLKTVSQECSQRLWLLGDALANQGNITGRQRGFDFAGDALQPKLTAWIGGSITTKDGFFHDKPKSLDFEQGGVMARTVLTSPEIVELAPFLIELAVLPSEEPGCENPFVSKEHFEHSPSGKIPSFTLEIVAVAFVQEFWNPSVPRLAANHPASALLRESFLGDKLASEPGLPANTYAQSSGFIAKFAKAGLELDPPEGTVLSSVEARHVVYPNVTRDKI